MNTLYGLFLDITAGRKDLRLVACGPWPSLARAALSMLSLIAREVVQRTECQHQGGIFFANVAATIRGNTTVASAWT